MKKLPEDMLNAAKAVLRNAYAPYSHFPVAVCIRSDQNQLFVGCNVENAAYPIGNCAEASAISHMITQGHREIKELLVLVPGEKFCPPCGACRQRLIEFSALDLPIHLCSTNGDYYFSTLKELMPVAFGPDNLERP